MTNKAMTPLTLEQVVAQHVIDASPPERVAELRAILAGLTPETRIAVDDNRTTTIAGLAAEYLDVDNDVTAEIAWGLAVTDIVFGGARIVT